MIRTHLQYISALDKYEELSHFCKNIHCQAEITAIMTDILAYELDNLNISE